MIHDAAFVWDSPGARAELATRPELLEGEPELTISIARERQLAGSDPRDDEPREGLLADPDPDGRGHTLVPLDAWEKMLVQLGNLHEAGQQLADARERAAKAETEASFLRERLAEMREREQERLAAEAVAEIADSERSARLRWWRRRR